MNVLYVFDIDATLADATERIKAAGSEPDRSNKQVYLDWLSRIQSFETLMKDKPVPGMADLVKSVRLSVGPSQLIYLTSREEIWRDVTEFWLHRYGFPLDGNLYMRPNNDWRSSAQFKEATIKDLTSKRAILFDDDADAGLEEVCKRNGWTLLKAVSGGNPSKKDVA